MTASGSPGIASNKSSWPPGLTSYSSFLAAVSRSPRRCSTATSSTASKHTASKSNGSTQQWPAAISLQSHEVCLLPPSRG